MSDLYIKAPISYEWVRPIDWLTIPPISTGEQVFYSVFAVYDVVFGNFVAFSFAGNYTVDWGDGFIENVASGVTAQHQYNWANVGNVTSKGFRQALIKVTPQSGQNLTAIDLQKNHSTIGASKNSQHLDIVMSLPNVTTINFWTGTVVNRQCERVWIKSMGNITSLYALFHLAFPRMQSVILPDTSNVTNMQYLLSGCSALKTVPLFNTQNVTSTSQMFSGCTALAAVPLFNLQSVTSAQLMFNGCTALATVPLFNLQNVTNVNSMFNNCASLLTVPLFNLSSVLNVGYMFANCRNLQSIPLFNLTSVTSTDQMFNGCFSLVTVPSINISNATNTYAMFYQCPALTTLSLNLSSTTNSSLFFNLSNSLQKFTATGLRYGISLQNCQMSAAELNNFFTSLGTAVGSQTIVVTGNHGASTCNTSIATTKGFTVTI